MEITCPHCNQRNRVPGDKLDHQIDCGRCKKELLKGPIEAAPPLLAEMIAQRALPVLVDFWAPWCGPCRMFAPAFKSAAEKFGGEVAFLKVDTEAHQQAGLQHQIRSIPTLASFYQGKEIGRISGALPPAELQKLVQELIGATK